jgi:geranylgeranyl transferase type-2 subunit alpha
LEQEFEFTTELIEKNFSNYSAWHQRSAVLQEIHINNPDGFRKALLDGKYLLA